MPHKSQLFTSFVLAYISSVNSCTAILPLVPLRGRVEDSWEARVSVEFVALLVDEQLALSTLEALPTQTPDAVLAEFTEGTLASPEESKELGVLVVVVVVVVE
ncbi:hypothetical protein E2C01_035342 [Portunus trituberculatus]|uniref:Secreted protein n=1 Tax=Portunus trituberculatus TaxID=210409 RepID=A0A5B7F2Z3_PORTR|nr:hypothetical protein [Portunus trituberculatus]